MKDSPRPYRWAEWLISHIAAPHLREELLGDLDEFFYKRGHKYGYSTAKLLYLVDILLLLHPRLWRRLADTYGKTIYSSSFILHPDMLRNYFKIAFRNLFKNKVYSFINISGLAVGIACCLAICLYVYDEFSFDRFHTNAHNLYRIVEKQNQAGTLYDVASSPGPLSPTLKAEFAEIKQYCRFDRYWGILKHDSTIIEDIDILGVDHSFFNMFSFPLLRGNVNQALLNPNEIIITESAAERFFGSQWKHSTNILGQPFQFKDKTFTLTGIAQNPPHNSHIQFDILFSYLLTQNDKDQYKWNNDSHYNYILLQPHTDVASLEKKIFSFMNKYRPSDKPTIRLQPMLDIYLNPDFSFQTDWQTKGSRLYIWVFISVGSIVLLIALFNFMNLSTARAMKRAQEVGVRKAIGAVRLQLVVQFLGESLLLTLLSVISAIGLLILFLPLLNEIAAKSLTIPFAEPGFWLVIIGFTLLISFLAGMYPAFYLSGFQPVKVLKGVFNVQSGQLFRRTLVVSQFTMSVMLVTGAIVIYKQLTFMQNRSLGFDKSQLLSTWIRPELHNKIQMIKADLQQQSSIAQVTLTTGNLVDMNNSTYDFSWEGQAPGEGMVITHANSDPEFLKTTGMKLIAGRNFDPKIASDTTDAYLINETAAKRMKWTPEQALGKTITFWQNKGKVIGVLKDFHFRPLTAAIEPFLLRYWPHGQYNYNNFLIKTRPDMNHEGIVALEQIYKKYNSIMPPYYEFVDQSLENQYRTEQRTSKVVFYFSALAILVSCLGLFGLVTFTAEQRTKEIGTRKVLGATVTNIVTLLSKDFLQLVVLAIIIASPLAWFLMNQWLADFAYKTNFEWWIFALSGFLAIVIALITVSFKAIRAALINPVKSLRSE
ncbi:ABC transporter permease [Emticicia sp. BO119]|uniref:ABC transporter permease n=1 Tax=Emticicia sp. BO119 TaxID=2757768 RepID=UPI001C6A1B7E|nr:ABC transporter permease [Emticicia sp. BO119]